MIKSQNKIYCLLVFVFLSLGTSSIVNAQEEQKKRIDSILISVKTENYTDKKKSYNRINNLIIKNKPERASELFKYTLLKDSSEIAKMIIYDSYSKNLSSKGFADDALLLRLDALAIAKKLNDENEEVLYHTAIASSYVMQNKPDKASYHLNIAEPLAEKEKNRGLLWVVYYNRAEVQIALKDYTGAADYNLLMWSEFKDSENTSKKRFVLYMLVDFFSQTDSPIQQAKFTELLAQHYEKAYPDMPPGHAPIKSIFDKQVKKENISKYKRAIYVSDSLNSINSLIYTTYALSDIYRGLNRPKEALPYLKNVERRIDTINKPQQLMTLYLTLASTNEEANDYYEAYQYTILESRLRDSITSNKMQKNIAELKVKFDTEKKEREILEQKNVISKKNTQRNQIVFGFIVFGIVSLFTILFFINKLKYQKTITAQTKILQQQKIKDLQQKNKLLALNSMIEGQEAERLRIAKDLHDSLGGLLSTVKMHFHTIQREIEQLEKFNLTKQTNELINEACIEVRRISHNMMPHALSISGLKGAIEDLGEQLSQQGYQTIIKINNIPENIDETKKIMIYRLVQEIISNTRKHAKAKSIFIQLSSNKDELNLVVKDNGKGFNYTDALEKNGLGLKSINSRVEFLDGNIDWDTQPNNGTTITITIPT